MHRLATTVDKNAVFKSFCTVRPTVGIRKKDRFEIEHDASKSVFV
jgi:hypothetical protein